MVHDRINVVILSTPDEKEKTTSEILQIVSRFKISENSVSFKYGSPDSNSQHLFVSVGLPQKKAFDIIKELTLEGLEIISNEPFIKGAIRAGRIELNDNKIDAVQQISKTKNVEGKSSGKSYSVESIAETGDWQLLIKIAKNQSLNNIETSRKVKEMLPELLQKIIDAEIGKETDNMVLLNMKVDKLLKIAISSDLNLLRLQEYMTLAGEAVIYVCAKHPKEFTSELISLSNSPMAVPLIKMKAFITFYKIVSADQETYKNEITTASRMINTRGLNTISHSVFNLSDDDKKVFEEGVEFFVNERMNPSA